MNRRDAIAILLATIAAPRTTNPEPRRPLESQVLRPPGPQDLTSLTIAQAAARLARREFTPLQLANAYLARIDKLNKDLNAYITVTRELARREAREAKPNGLMSGIPIAHKDLFETRGVRTTAGSMLFEMHTPETNAAVVQQLEDAGAVLLGKTNTHELGGGVTTINPFFGTTRNPIDRTRIPGGSSGGSAAAVVAQLCAGATGSDTGGSVRIPAAFCGCVGFKPTHGRISTQGLIAASPTFDHVGFLTRTVEDAEIMFRAAIGASSNPPPSSVSSPPLSDAASIRVGVARNYFFDGLEPPVATALESVLSSLKQRATLADVRFPVSDETMSTVFDPIFMFELWHRFGADWRTDPGSFSKEFSAVFAFERPSVAEYETALAALKAYQLAVDKLFDTVDVIITPTVAITAPPIAGPIDAMKILRNTLPFNAAGTPAISIPIAGTALPVGLQLIARRNNDDKLLQIARRFS
jgi:aspartyl-tRNA(Asn)/glutamyl-tRNA(Gln) amidotransferase subunit A